MKKVFSLLLSIIMLLSISTGINLSAYAATYYESEDNGSYSNANYIPLNSTIYGNCKNYYNNDLDCYRFKLEKVGRVNITFSFSKMNADGSWYVELYKYNENNDYSLLNAKTVYIFDGTYKFSTYGLSAGTYYIRVGGDGVADEGIQYGVTVNFSECNNWETEFNDDYTSADNLYIGTTRYGNCSNYYNNDLDCYRFKLEKAGGVNITFSFSKMNADGSWYVELYKYNGNNDYSLLNAKTVYIFDGTYKFSTYGLSAGTYYIRVSGDGVADEGLQYGVTVNYFIPKPSKFRVSSRNTSSLKLAWNKASGVSGYQLQRKSGGSYETVANTTSTSYTVSNLTSATAYTFRVRAYKKVNGTKYYSGWTTLTTPTKPGTPSIKAPATNKKHQIIAKWNTVARASGYQVQYSKNKNFNSVIATKTVSGQSKTSYTGNNFTKGKTYYVRVRAYKTVNGTKYYGAWSKVKSIKSK